MKFRIWDKNKNKMIENIKITQKENDKIIEVLNDKNKFKKIKEKNCVIMEYIGLNDLDDKEIFENDIVSYEDGEYSFIGYVIKNPFGTYVKSNYDYHSFEDFADENDNVADCKIIGNIFEW